MAVCSEIDNGLFDLFEDSLDELSCEAMVSALSFPGMPTWLGIQQILVLVPELLRLSAVWIMS
jgi:hypothetical protein